jgi:hypothetical protein
MLCIVSIQVLIYATFKIAPFTKNLKILGIYLNFCYLKINSLSEKIADEKKDVVGGQNV